MISGAGHVPSEEGPDWATLGAWQAEGTCSCQSNVDHCGKIYYLLERVCGTYFVGIFLMRSLPMRGWAALIWPRNHSSMFTFWAWLPLLDRDAGDYEALYICYVSLESQGCWWGHSEVSSGHWVLSRAPPLRNAGAKEHQARGRPGPQLSELSAPLHLWSRCSFPFVQ